MKITIGRRVVAISGVVGLAAGFVTVAEAGTAQAVGGPTTLFNQDFTSDQILASNGAISFPSAPVSDYNLLGINSACLTVAQTTSSPLPDCATTPNSSGAGALQLTANSTKQEGGIFAATSVPASQGLDLKFDSYQYGGDGADGIAFVLAAVDPSNPLSPPMIGQAGGSLGYSAQGSTLPGLSDGYLGIGIDAWGNFSRDAFGGTDCPTDPSGFGTGVPVPNHVTVRGPGHDSVGYCGLVSSSDTEQLDVTGANGGTRANSHIPVEVVINSTDSTFTTTNGSDISVPAGKYAIVYQPIGASSWDELSGTLPSVSSTYYGSETSAWIDGNGIPRQLAFGWVASTGGSMDTHEINNVVVTSINPVPKLAVDQTIQDVATAPGGPTIVPPGDPVTYTINPSVDSTGADEDQPITVTDTLPTGVTPTSAGGNGWVCAPPSGQKISCTNSNVPFPAGTDLPPITVNGTVTEPGGVDESTVIETNSVTTASSPDADPAYTDQAASAEPATALSNLAIDPTLGTAGSAATISSTTGEDLSGVSQVSVDSTYLTPCTSGPATGCFSYDSTAGDIEISSMPALALGASTVTVVNGGALSNAMTYTYIAAPDAPTVTATSHDDGHTTIDWTPGATNGSTVTSWTVTPLLADGTSSGVTAATVSDASATTYDFAGLTKGTEYKFDVVAHTSNAGDSPAGESNTVTPPLDLSLTTTTLDSGEANLAGYSQTMTSTGGTGPYSWAATGLPAGLALSTAGVLSGTPTAAFDGTVAITVTDADGSTSERDLALSIAADPAVTTTSLPAVVVSHSYSQTLAVSGGVGPFTWAVTAGTLPVGLALDPSTGVVSGTPTQVTHATFTVTVTDANGLTASGVVTLSISPVPPTVPAAPPGAVDTTVVEGSNPTATTSDPAHGGATLTATGTGTGDLRVSSLGSPSDTTASGISTTDPAISGPTAGGLYNVALGSSQSLTAVTVTIHGTPSSSIYWWDGSAWQKVPGVTRTESGDLVLNVTATSVPNLGQLSNATFAAGAIPLTRLAGPTRIETAVAVSKAEFPTAGSATAVVLARDDVFADALTGGPLAAAKNAPLLLTETHSLLTPVLGELVRVLPKGGTVYLLGNTNALDASVANAVTSRGYHTVRVGGADRYATSVEIAGILGNPSTVFEVTGVNFPDAASAGPAAIQAKGAVLLTAGAVQPKVVASYLQAHPARTMYAVGGQAASADAGATPVVGADRYSTSAKVAATFFAHPHGVGVATGEDFADALVAAPTLGRGSRPLLLTSSTSSLPPAVAGYLHSNADSIASATIYGGTSSVPASLAAELQIDTP